MTEEILVIIPARGGSKGIPRKNVQLVAGKPLLAHTIGHARNTPAVDRVVVSTDDAEIGAVAEEYGAEVVWRPAAICGDEARSESALVHALDVLQEREGYEPNLVVSLQATSPMRQPDDVARAIEQLRRAGADSLFSARPLHGFVWRREEGELASFSYDYRQRQRRQDAPEDFVENGSIYVFKPWVLRRFDNRLGGKIAMYVMDPLDSFQVDAPGDLALMEKLLAVRRPGSVPDLREVQLLVLDFDGVLTDNRARVDENGVEAVTVHRGDGWGIARVREAGVAVMVLSTEKNPVVAARCHKLGIDYIQGSDDKLAALRQVVEEKGLRREQVAFVGNDVNDLDCLGWVGVPLAVQDAVPDVHAVACWATSRPGGYGAVREICDLILEQSMGR